MGSQRVLKGSSKGPQTVLKGSTDFDSILCLQVLLPNTKARVRTAGGRKAQCVIRSKAKIALLCHQI